MVNDKRLLLEHLFKDVSSPVAYTSVEPLLTEARKHNAKITRQDVKEFLATQTAYTLHRQAKRKYTRLPTLAPGLHTEWQADLSVFDRLARHNKGYRYLLVCIDTLSRQLFVEPVRSKSAQDMIGAFERVFKRSRYVPWKLLTDAGKEFTAKKFKTIFAPNKWSIFACTLHHSFTPEWPKGQIEASKNAYTNILRSARRKIGLASFKLW